MQIIFFKKPVTVQQGLNSDRMLARVQFKYC